MKTEFYLKVPNDLYLKLPIYMDNSLGEACDDYDYDEEEAEFRENYGITYIDPDERLYATPLGTDWFYCVYFSSLHKMMEFQLQYL
jgi:hypothetical protein